MKINFSNNLILKNPSFKSNNPNKDTFIEPDSFERPYNGVDKTPPSVATEKPLLPVRRERGQVLDKKGAIFNNHTTSMFRGDLNWKNFGNFLVGRFSEYNKVNVYNYAASSGEEPYSLSILLQSRFKEDADKFFPIYAKDLSRKKIAENILKQKFGNIYIKEAYDRAQTRLRIDNNELKTFIQPDNLLYGGTLQPKVIKPVKFSRANILEDIKNIDSKNPSLVMCRNMWPYIKSDEYEEYAKKLYEKLATGSVVVIGFFDYTDDYSDTIFPNALIEAGFNPVPNENGPNLIFTKDYY